MKTFGGYTCDSGNIYGYYNSSKVEEYDELRQFRVAFKEDGDRTKVLKLQRFLAAVCADIGEKCIYFECDEDTMLIFP